MKEPDYYSLVNEDFSKNAKNYNNYAFIQRVVAYDLIKFAVPYIQKKNNSNILDLGCGTGLVGIEFLQQIHNIILENYTYTQCDLSQEMCKQAYINNKLPTIQANFDKLPKHFKSFNLIFSSFSLHWSYAYKDTVFNILQRLEKHGQFILSFPTQNSLKELYSIYKQLNLHYLLPNFIQINEFKKNLQKIHLISPISFDLVIKKYSSQYNNLWDLLRMIKNIGGREKKKRINNAENKLSMNLKKINNLYIKNYTNQQNKIVASWEICFIKIKLL